MFWDAFHDDAGYVRDRAIASENVLIIDGDGNDPQAKAGNAAECRETGNTVAGARRRETQPFRALMEFERVLVAGGVAAAGHPGGIVAPLEEPVATEMARFDFEPN